MTSCNETSSPRISQYYTATVQSRKKLNKRWRKTKNNANQSTRRLFSFDTNLNIKTNEQQREWNEISACQMRGQILRGKEFCLRIAQQNDELSTIVSTWHRIVVNIFINNRWLKHFWQWRDFNKLFGIIPTHDSRTRSQVACKVSRICLSSRRNDWWVAKNMINYITRWMNEWMTDASPFFLPIVVVVVFKKTHPRKNIEKSHLAPQGHHWPFKRCWGNSADWRMSCAILIWTFNAHPMCACSEWSDTVEGSWLMSTSRY